MLACLLVMKFVGPPPRAFLLRVLVVAVMLTVTLYSGIVRDARETSTALMTVNVALGLVLLGWYVRE